MRIQSLIDTVRYKKDGRTKIMRIERVGNFNEFHISDTFYDSDLNFYDHVRMILEKSVEDRAYKLVIDTLSDIEKEVIIDSSLTIKPDALNISLLSEDTKIVLFVTSGVGSKTFDFVSKIYRAIVELKESDNKKMMFVIDETLSIGKMNDGLIIFKSKK